MTELKTNVLYYGDNLEILRHHIPDESVDLVYLDPPFNSQADYNVLFREESGERSAAQIKAFSDFWRWDSAAEETYREIIETCPDKVATMVSALRQGIGSNDVMAYLVMMTLRLVELRRVLKATGSLYLHCDPTASHYLKVVMDTVFGPVNFRSEIVWRRSNAHNKLSRQYGPIHDTLLFYSRTGNTWFKPGRRPYARQYVKERFPYEDGRGRYQSNVLTGSGVRTGDSGKPWRGYDPTPKGRHWGIPSSLARLLPRTAKSLSVQEILDALDKAGLILHPKGDDSLPRYKQYLSSAEGVLFQDIWAFQPGTRGLLVDTDEGIDEDVKWLDSDDERLGYPTQKPVGLLERIIQSSAAPGALVLDPFCGCGTAVVAAQKLGRRWIGIDITYLAVDVMRKRLCDSFPADFPTPKDVMVIGEPVDVAGAHALATQDRYQFQWWALSLVNALPAGDERKKGADTGIDGVIGFVEEKGKAARVIVSVKSGHVTASQVRDLKGVVEREKASIGLFITLESLTQPMHTEAVSAGFYHSALWDKDYPKVQILTVEELLAGKQPLLPPSASGGFAKAPRVGKTEGEQRQLLP